MQDEDDALALGKFPGSTSFILNLDPTWITSSTGTGMYPVWVSRFRV